MKKEPRKDLGLLFLRLIAEETPDATAVLFSLRDAGKWMEHYGVFADWLEMFLRDVLEQGQEHIDWVVENRETFGQAAIWSRPSKRPWKRPPERSAQAQAWLRTLNTYRMGQVIMREAVKRHPDRIAYSDPAIDKRSGETHCRWLVRVRFGGEFDTDIQKETGVNRSEIGKRRREFAEQIGLTLKSQRGRRR